MVQWKKAAYSAAAEDRAGVNGGPWPAPYLAEPAGLAPTVAIATGPGAAPLGGEFRINDITEGDQGRADLVALDDGGFIATWVSATPTSYDYYAQRYDAAGAAVGPPTPIGPGGIGLIGPAAGGFVTVWSADDGSGRGIFAQRHDEALSPVGDPFRVNSVTASSQQWPVGVALEGGGFVVAWESPDGGNTGIFAQIYDADANAVGGEFRANVSPTYGQLGAKTIALPGGGFLISWVTAQPAAMGGGDIFAQRFDASGNRVGGEFKVNSYITGTQWNQAIAVLEDGGLIFVWDGPGFDGHLGIWGRRYDAAGQALGPDIRISEFDGIFHQVPHVAPLAGGGFVVTWDTNPKVLGEDNIFGQSFDAAGNRIGPQFQVSSSTPGGQNAPRVQALADGRFVVMWTSHQHDGGGSGVYGQIFEPAFHAIEQNALDLKNMIAIGDGDAASEAMSVTLSVDHGILDLLAGTSGVGITGSGSDTVTITGTLAEVQALLGSDPTSAVDYIADSDAPPATALLTILVEDGDGLTAGAAETIHVRPINDAPVNMVGGTAATIIDEPVALTGISVSEPDATGAISVHLGVAHGTLTILTDVPGGITDADISGGGNGTGGIALTASPERINATLAAAGGLTYRGDPGFWGRDALTVSTHDGLFSDPAKIAWIDEEAVFAAPTDIAAADLNGDGALDIVVSYKSTGTISVLLGTGDGHLAPPVNYGGGAQTFGVALVNLNDNQDDFLDIVVTNYGGGTIGVLRGNGNGTFQPQATTPLQLAQALVAADFNGDGHADTASTRRNDGIEILFGNGNGGFSGRAHHDVGTDAEGPFSPVAIDKGDFNGDGFVDLIVANSSGGTANGSVSLLLGGANGAFAEAIVTPAPTGPRDIAVADLNGDGSMDFALANSLGNEVSVFLGNGDGSFQPGVAYTVSRPSLSLAIADYNGDGRPDIVAGIQGASPTAARLEMLIGNGDGTFRPGGWEIISDHPVALVSGDFDGDGRMDVAAAENPRNSVSIFANLDNSLSDLDTKSIIVNGPNQAPSGTDGTQTVAEDGVFTFGTSHFGFSDPDGDGLLGVRITAAPVGGKLFFDGDGAGGNAPVEVSAFPTILYSAADIVAGKLTFVPSANLNGAGAASVQFQVQDDGGLGLGGADADASPNRLTLNVSAVNDAPAPAFGGGFVAEHSPIGSLVGQASATDIDSAASSLVFSLDDDAGGRFAIDPLSGEIEVADRSAVDFESASSHQVTIRVTDPGGAFATVAGTITLADVAETLTGGGGADDLSALSDEDWLVQGAGGDDRLGGRGGDDRLDGGAGADIMAGAGGDDFYLVDNPIDTVSEAAGGGGDTVTSAIDYTLPDEVESLILAGSAVIGAGNELANIIVGNAAANTLVGHGGADQLRGGSGDDLYILDMTADVVVELAGQGTDTVRSSAGYTLPDHVEQLILTGGGSHNGTGNALANTLTGNNGNNRLDGRGGADTMAGGAGHDTYVVNSAGDQVIEAGSSGADTVESAVAFRLPTHVEKLILTGSLGYDGIGNAGANTITGNSGGNFLNGGRGNDVIAGGAGNDQLMGNIGNDSLTGGAGADRFYFNAGAGAGNADDILDFSAADDSLWLLRSAFTRAGANGTLSASAFHQGTSAADAGDRILYDSATGNIFYDADGTGAVPALLFATVDPGIALSHADFVIYG